jgi:hypothetical protein
MAEGKKRVITPDGQTPEESSTDGTGIFDATAGVIPADAVEDGEGI